MFVYFIAVQFTTADMLIMTSKQDHLQFGQSIPVWLLLGLKGLFQCGQMALSSGRTPLRGLGCSPSDRAPVASVPWRLSEATHAEVQQNSTNRNIRMAPKMHACMNAGKTSLALHIPVMSQHGAQITDIIVIIMKFLCTDHGQLHAHGECSLSCSSQSKYTKIPQERVTKH